MNVMSEVIHLNLNSKCLHQKKITYLVLHAIKILAWLKWNATNNNGTLCMLCLLLFVSPSTPLHNCVFPLFKPAIVPRLHNSTSADVRENCTENFLALAVFLSWMRTSSWSWLLAKLNGRIMYMKNHTPSVLNVISSFPEPVEPWYPREL